jgi:hypothetical protein
MQLVHLLNGYHGVHTFNKKANIKALRKKHDLLLKRYSDHKETAKYELDTDDRAESLLRDISNLENYGMATSFLQAAVDNLEKIENKHRITKISLEELVQGAIK